MEISNFITVDFLSSFTGTLFAVELIVFITKNLPIIKNIRTRIYTSIIAIAHILIMGIATGTAAFTVVYFYTSFIDALIITALLCGGYDVVIKKVQLIVNHGDKDKIDDNIE